MEVEKRISKRSKKELNIIFSNGYEFLSSYTEDLSSGGLFIRTESFLDEKEVFYIQFNLPETNEFIEAEAEVRWIKKGKCENQGMGIAFKTITEENLAKIINYIELITPP